MLDTTEYEELFHPVHVEHYTEPDGMDAAELTFESKEQQRRCAEYVIRDKRYGWAMMQPADHPGYLVYLHNI